VTLTSAPTTRTAARPRVDRRSRTHTIVRSPAPLRQMSETDGRYEDSRRSAGYSSRNRAYSAS
jgi:hypothetical protein